MIENAPLKQEHKEVLGIDKLLTRLIKMPEIETNRLKKDKVDAIMRQIVIEIPYAYLVITPTLAESLLADAPQKTDDLKLNETIANLGLALFEPNQKDKIYTEIQLYLSSRKATETEYATQLVQEILTTAELKIFPEKAQQEMIKMALSVLEKVINEKQLRMTPGYRLESLITIVEPFLYHRLFNPELERLRASHHLVFRKFINQIAQDGYEKINDEKKLLTIQKEKIAAFQQFSQNIKKMALVYPPLDTAHNKLHFLQKDRLIKQAEMKTILDTFAKPKDTKSLDGTLAYHLRARSNERLRRAFVAVDVKPEIYENELTIKQAHDDVYKIIKNDLFALKYLIDTVKTIRTQYHKKFFQIFAQTQALKKIDTLLLDTILGEAVMKTNVITKEKLSIRDGGYPKQTVKQIYSTFSVALAAMEQNASGLFAAKFKEEINRVLSELRKASLTVTEGVIKEPETVKATAAPTVAIVLEEPKAPVAAEKVVPEKVEAKPAPVVQPTPVKLEPVVTKAAPPVVEEPTQKVTPKPLLVEEEPAPVAAPKPAEKVEPKPLLPVEEEPAPVAKVEAKPLLPIEEEPAAATPPPLKIAEEPVAAIPEPLKVEEEPVIQLEKVTPKPLLAIEEFTEPAITAESTQEPMDSGAVIMKNYQLGDFEKPIYEAWKKMVSGTAEEQPTMDGGLMPLHSDSEVKLYVICDLAQQISAVNPANLPDDSKQLLHNIKSQILTALKDPMDEQNWDYFEGSHRDIIDGQLGAIL